MTQLDFLKLYDISKIFVLLILIIDKFSLNSLIISGFSESGTDSIPSKCFFQGKEFSSNFVLVVLNHNFHS